MIDRPVDQALQVTEFHCVAEREGDNPPTLLLRLDVVHGETNNEWRQELLFTRPSWVALMQLLAYVAKSEGVEWDAAS